MKKYFLFIALSFSFFSSCRKDPYYDPNAIDDYFTGIVYKDCNGNVLKNEKIILETWMSGCFFYGITDSVIGYTDSEGRYFFKHQSHPTQIFLQGTWNELFIPNERARFSIHNPGNYNVFPNDSLMNGYVQLHFNSGLPTNKKFYFQVIPISETGSYGLGDVQYITGPITETIIQLPSFRIYSVFESDSIHPVNGVFHCSVGKVYFDGYDPNHSAYINMTHSPCRNSDTLYYNVNIN